MRTGSPLASNRAGLSLAAVALAAASAAAQTGPLTWRTIALTGQPAPGFPAGVSFAALSDPRLDASGRVGLWIELAGPGINATNNSGLWSERSAPLAMVYRLGTESPIAGRYWTAIPSPAIDDNGLFALTGTTIASVPVPPTSTTPPTPVTLAVSSESPANTWSIVVQEGDTLTGVPGVLSGFHPVLVPSAGSLLFTTGGGTGLLTAPPLAALAARLQPAPGAAGNSLYFIDQPIPGGDGIATFRASLQPDSNPTPLVDPEYGLYAADAGGPTPIALTNTAAPGTLGTWKEFGISVARDATGRVAYWGRAVDAAMVERHAIVAGAVGTPTVIAAQSDPAPGTTLTYGPLGRRPLIAAGKVAFSARLDGGTTANDAALFLTTLGSTTQLIAQEGQVAPRLADSPVFAGFSEPWLDSAGRVVFTARLTGPSVTRTNNAVLYAADPAGDLWPLARTGDLFTVAPGDTRVIDQIIVDSGPPRSGREALRSYDAPGYAFSRLAVQLIFRNAALPAPQQITRGIFMAEFGCYANCDGSVVAPALNVADFVCFLNRFAADQALPALQQSGAYSNCDGSITPPAINIADFICFLNRFGAGCG
ncbi:MAG: choice-of-anchor tandem repeat NxxGxxAF-containing protein [Phycisphaerales bacterium]